MWNLRPIATDHRTHVNPSRRCAPREVYTVSFAPSSDVVCTIGKRCSGKGSRASPMRSTRSGPQTHPSSTQTNPPSGWPFFRKYSYRVRQNQSDSWLDGGHIAASCLCLDSGSHRDTALRRSGGRKEVVIHYCNSACVRPSTYISAPPSRLPIEPHVCELPCSRELSGELLSACGGFWHSREDIIHLTHAPWLCMLTYFAQDFTIATGATRR